MEIKFEVPLPPLQPQIITAYNMKLLQQANKIVNAGSNGVANQNQSTPLVQPEPASQIDQSFKQSK